MSVADEIHRDLYEALEGEGMTGDVVIAVMAHLAADETSSGLQARIIVAARAMTAVGISPRTQVRVFFRAFGAGIGGGGGAGSGRPRPDPCPWCGGTGSHGGLCPGPALGYPP